MQAKLIRNAGYTWIEQKGIYFKGYFFWNNILFQELGAIEAFQSIDNYSDFISFVAKLNGCFAIIIQKDKATFAAVDRASSFPLFFSSNGQYISDSSEHIRESMGIEKESVSKPHLLELMTKTYLMLNDTVYEQIKQLNLGQALCADDNSISIDYYYRHLQPVTSITRESAKEKTTDIIYSVFEDIKKVINGRPVILSLSGGYDSRLVACMLKEIGVDDVLCYTYGKKTSYEVSLAKQVADNLGYRLHYIEYSKDKMRTLLADEQVRTYYTTYTEHNFLGYIMNFIAVQDLFGKGLIAKNAVFITGLCGDMPTGIKVPSPEQLKNVELNRSYLAKAFYKSALIYYQPVSEVADYFISKLEQDIPNIQIQNTQDYVSALDCLEVSASHAHSFIRMNDSHEFFGGQWLMPLWDNNWLNFWYSLPMEMRYKQNLYEDWLMTGLFKKYDCAVRKTDIPTSRKIVSVPTVPNLRQRLKSKLRIMALALLNRVAFAFGISVRYPNSDVNNLSLLHAQLYKKIRNKNIINRMRITFFHLDCIRICEDRYGIKTVKKIKPYIDSRN